MHNSLKDYEYSGHACLGQSVCVLIIEVVLIEGLISKVMSHLCLVSA